MITICNADRYIYVRHDGALVVESIFKKQFDGDSDLLLSCVEDNISDTGEAEIIDWPAAIRDYRKAITIKKQENNNKEYRKSSNNT